MPKNVSMGLVLALDCWPRAVRETCEILDAGTLCSKAVIGSFHEYRVIREIVRQTRGLWLSESARLPTALLFSQTQRPPHRWTRCGGLAFQGSIPYVLAQPEETQK